MSIEVVYTAHAVATGDGRNGHVASSDGLVDTALAIPAEMGGPGGATNPEQLFAAGYAACFHSALRIVAKTEQVTLDDDTTIDASVGIGANGQGGYGLTVSLAASLPGLSQEQADDLVAKAHQVCPYSNATRGNIEVTLSTTV